MTASGNDYKLLNDQSTFVADLRARADEAEAALDRVRAVCDLWQSHPNAMTYATLGTVAFHVRAAIEGEKP